MADFDPGTTTVPVTGNPAVGAGHTALVMAQGYRWHDERMCGRYAASRDVEELQTLFDVVETDPQRLPASYNIAPTQTTYIVDSAAEHRRLRVVHWGLVPSWSRDATGAARLINARCESITEKPSYKQAYARRRCLLPMDGWYEWSGTEKQPWYISRKDGIAAIAGIYERWTPPNVDPADPRNVLHTCALITTDNNDDLAHVHDRMPVVVDPKDFDWWLDPESNPEDLRSLLKPAPLGILQAWKVSRAVSQVRNDGPQLIEPQDPPEQIGLFD